MSLACLMGYVAHRRLVVDEAGGEVLCHRQQSALVVAHIHYQSVAQPQVGEDSIEIATAYAALKRRHVDVAYIVGQNAVFHSACQSVFGTEIHALQRVAEVDGVVLMPVPVACGVERRHQIDVAVAQLVEHLAAHLKQLFPAHVRQQHLAIAAATLPPVETILRRLIAEEAVVLVNYLPQGIEVAPRRITELVLGNATSEHCCHTYYYNKV